MVLPDGVFSVAKEKGSTSQNVLNKIKAMVLQKNPGLKKKQIKLGHGGTLDPFATGVLVVGIGSGCKALSQYLSGEKEYRAVVRVGQETDTFDRTGKTVLQEDGQRPDIAALSKIAAEKYVGKIMQRPPIYSAVHVDGKRAHALAREGKLKEEDMKEREVSVVRIDIEKSDLGDEYFDMVVVSQKGVYVRSLGVSLCRETGVLGAVWELERTRQGEFTIGESLSVEECGDLEKIRAHIERARGDVPSGST
ncbi:MAG: tRNA pseudouridine synthase [Amphiamblys sp. WSBS2006]|nr:MAG: tRNA pseudouridine synthase [Amphiamblys sp. WSBS2006]